MSSRAGSALVPSSRIVAPFTVTRPSSISCSDARREAMPACDRIFCRRSISPTLYHEGHEEFRRHEAILYKDVFVPFFPLRVFVMRKVLSGQQVTPETRQ